VKSHMFLEFGTWYVSCSETLANNSFGLSKM